MQPRRTIRGVKGNGAGVTAETLVERAREALPEGQPQAEESGVGMVVCARKRPLNDAERAQRALDVVTCRNPTVCWEGKTKCEFRCWVFRLGSMR